MGGRKMGGGGFVGRLKGLIVGTWEEKTSSFGKRVGKVVLSTFNKGEWPMDGNGH
jgi:hypothetical protein